MLPFFLRQRDFPVPAVAERALDKDAEFDARSRDAIANLAETFAQDGDEVARRRRLRMKAQAQEKAV